MNFNFSASLELCLKDSSILRLQPALPPLPSVWASHTGLDTRVGNIHTCPSSQHSRLLSLGLGVPTPATWAVLWRSPAGAESGLGADWTGGLGSVRVNWSILTGDTFPKQSLRPPWCLGSGGSTGVGGWGEGGGRDKKRAWDLGFGVGILANRSSATCLL